MSIKDEFAFINKINPKTSKNNSLIVGIGDDAALYKSDENFDEIVCMDTMVEEVHFKNETMKPYHTGYKALAANISDIAAMGGIPTFYLVSIAVPQSWSEEQVLQVYEGMNDLANEHEVELIGGDTVSSKDKLVITITVLGRVEKGRRLLRRNAKPDDIVFVSGTLGDSAAGLNLLLKQGVDFGFSSDEKFLVHRHQIPTPRVELGRILSDYSRVALNDVSDGIASEANEIAEASGVAIVLDKQALPKSKEIQLFSSEKQTEWMLNGGEDFELIGTISPSEWEQLQLICKNRGMLITRIGYVKNGAPKVELHDGNKIVDLTKQGFNHFK